MGVVPVVGAALRPGASASCFVQHLWRDYSTLDQSLVTIQAHDDRHVSGPRDGNSSTSKPMTRSTPFSGKRVLPGSERHLLRADARTGWAGAGQGGPGPSDGEAGGSRR